MKAILASACILTISVASAMAETTEERLSHLELQLAKLQIEIGQSDSASKARIGGYGELHYNNLNGSGGASDKDVIDFHRFVIYVGYDFSDKIHFNSEFELEHSISGDGQPGEIELEQAFIDFDVAEEHTLRAGLFLMPIGILNITHEPTTFYGVERNSIEKNILPTTWWEAGAGVYGSITDDLQYSAYIHSGLMTSTNSSYSIRSGRQKVANANAYDLAATVALKWSVPGITAGGSLQYQSDITQGNDSEAGSAVLGEIHIDLNKGPFGLRALYSEWGLDGEGPEAIGADRQYGWYIEPSLKLCEHVGVFVRYGEWNNIAGSYGTDGLKAETSTGMNWWPHEQVVVKADYQWQNNDNDKEQNGFNLGFGYAF